jgi:hypothetical protein
MMEFRENESISILVDDSILVRNKDMIWRWRKGSAKDFRFLQ